MQLCQLLSVFSSFHLGPGGSEEVDFITSDSRKINSSSIFVAVRGSRHDGHDFLPEVLKKSPLAVVVEDSANIPENYDGGLLVVEDSRQAYNILSARFFGRPGDSLFSVGITGTNGKTTTSYIVESLLNAFSWPTGVIGTINHHLGETVWQSELTTPDCFSFQQRLSDFKSAGAEALAVEVSSHALDQKRIGEIPFDVGIFLNLSRDHLDYHDSMEDYFEAKEKLFNEHFQNSEKPIAILNYDDPWVKKTKVAEHAKKLAFGFGEHPFRIHFLGQTVSGMNFTIESAQFTEEFFLPMIGPFNAMNATAAVLTAWSAGASFETIRSALKSFKGVPGRLQRVQNDKAYNIFVDYAHTPDALSNVLNGLVELKKKDKNVNRILCLFGCGGDRDKGKRPLMMEAALKYSDQIFLTSDNPRTEDPKKIIEDCLEKCSSKERQSIVSIENRREAIQALIENCQPGDVALIAGKGHEDYQIIGTKKIHFSDYETAKEIVNGL